MVSWLVSVVILGASFYGRLVKMERRVTNRTSFRGLRRACAAMIGGVGRVLRRACPVTVNVDAVHRARGRMRRHHTRLRPRRIRDGLSEAMGVGSMTGRCSCAGTLRACTSPCVSNPAAPRRSAFAGKSPISKWRSTY